MSLNHLFIRQSTRQVFNESLLVLGPVLTMGVRMRSRPSVAAAQGTPSLPGRTAGGDRACGHYGGL